MDDEKKVDEEFVEAWGAACALIPNEKDFDECIGTVVEAAEGEIEVTEMVERLRPMFERYKGEIEGVDEILRQAEEVKRLIKKGEG